MVWPDTPILLPALVRAQPGAEPRVLLTCIGSKWVGVWEPSLSRSAAGAQGRRPRVRVRRSDLVVANWANDHRHAVLNTANVLLVLKIMWSSSLRVLTCTHWKFERPCALGKLYYAPA